VLESTLPTTVSGQEDKLKEEDEDTQTIFTDGQSLHLLEATTIRLINAFAGEVYECVTKVSNLQRDSVSRIWEALPEMLKEFTHELAESVETTAQRHAKTFVRHYRK